MRAGIVKSIIGVAIAKDAKGVERVLKVGDEIALGESVLTQGIDSKAIIGLEGGKELIVKGNDIVKVDQSVAIGDSFGNEAIAEVAALQQALLQGQDIADLGETAAGEGAQGAGQLNDSIFDESGHESNISASMLSFDLAADANTIDDATRADIPYATIPPVPAVEILDGGDGMLNAGEIAQGVLVKITFPTGTTVGSTLNVDTNKDGTPDFTKVITADDITNGVMVDVNPNHVPADGVLVVDATVTNAAGITGDKGSDSAITDSTPPTITVNAPDLTNDNTPTIKGETDATPGSKVTITVTDNDGNTQTFEATVKPDGTYEADVPNPLPDGEYKVTAEVTDEAGNTGRDTDNGDGKGNIVDTTAPTLTITVDGMDADVNDNTFNSKETGTVTFTFSEKVEGFTIEDVNYDTAKMELSGFKKLSDTEYTATLTPKADIALTKDSITVNANAYTDVAKNANTEPSSKDVSLETNSPTIQSITVTDLDGNNKFKAGDSATAKIVFSEEVKGFAIDDITIKDATVSKVTMVDGGLSAIVEFTINNKPTDGKLTMSISDAYTDVYGNDGTGKTDVTEFDKDGGGKEEFDIDATAPTLIITVDGMNTDVNDNIFNSKETGTVTFTFSEKVEGFTIDDVIYDTTKMTIENLQEVASSNGTQYTATLTPKADIDYNDLQLVVNANAFTDAALNPNEPAMSNLFSVDTVVPTLEKIIVSGMEDATGIGQKFSKDTFSETEINSGKVQFVFSEKPADFTVSDIKGINGTTVYDLSAKDISITNLTAPTEANAEGKWVYTATLNVPANQDGADFQNLKLHVAKDSFTDEAGNANKEGATSNTFHIDTKDANITSFKLYGADGENDTTFKAGESAIIKIVFSESVSKVMPIVVGGKTVTFAKDGNDLTGKTWLSTVPADAVAKLVSGAQTLDLNFFDLAGNENTETITTNTITVDSIAPTIEIEVIGMNAQTGSNNDGFTSNVFSKGETGEVKVVFSEQPKDGTFDISDIKGIPVDGNNNPLITLGVLSNITKGTDGKWFATATLTAKDNVEMSQIKLYVDKDSFTDVAGNPNEPAMSNQFSIDTVAPAATIIIDPINTINAAEAAGYVTITGKVTGEFSISDTIELEINGTIYKNIEINTAGEFALSVAGSELVADGDNRIIAYTKAHDAAGNFANVYGYKDYDVNVAPVIDETNSQFKVAVSEEGLANGLKDSNGTSDTTDSATTTANIVIKDANADNMVITWDTATKPTDITSGGQVVSWTISGKTAVGYTGTANTASYQEVIKVVINDSITKVGDTHTATYTTTLLKPIDHPVKVVEDEDVENTLDINLKLNVSDGVNSAATHPIVTISVEDDSPFMKANVTQEFTSKSLGTNLMFVVDTSGSMDASRMAYLKAAMTNLVKAYAEKGALSVSIVDFHTNATFPLAWTKNNTEATTSQTINSSISTVINGLTKGGGTNYDAATQMAENKFNDAGSSANKISDGQNLIYFISDGEPTYGLNSSGGLIGDGSTPMVGMDATEETAWIKFLEANKINAQAIGMTGAIKEYMNPIAYDGVTKTDDDAKIVKVEDLNETLQSSVVTPPVSSNIVALAGDVAKFGFGADGGYISKVTIDGKIYEYNPTTNKVMLGTEIISGTSVFKIETASKSKLVFDMSNGSYEYTGVATINNETFVYEIVDRDGDKATGTYNLIMKNTNLAPEINASSQLKVAFAEDDIADGQNIAAAKIIINDGKTETILATWDNTALPTGIKSGGVNVVWTVSTDGKTIVGKAGAVEVMKVEMTGVTNKGDGTHEVDYTTALLKPIDHSAAGRDVLDLEFGVKVNDTVNPITKTTVTVSVEDDMPSVRDTITQGLTSTKAPTNLMLVLDVSGSMDGYYKRMPTLKSAANKLIEKYEAISGKENLSISVVTFASAATVKYTWTTGVDGVKSWIVDANGLVANTTSSGSATNYSAALTAAKGLFTDTVGMIKDAQNLVYFISDGEPNQPSKDIIYDNYKEEYYLKSSIENGWTSALKTNKATAFAIGIGEAKATSLNQVAYDGATSTDTTATIIGNNLAKLDSTLLDTVKTPPVSGDIFTLSGGDAGFGADGAGYVSKFAIGTKIFTFNGNKISGGAVGDTISDTKVTFKTTAGSEMTFDMKTGTYAYKAGSTMTTEEKFTYTLTDKDGDTTKEYTLVMSKTVSDDVVLYDGAKTLDGGTGFDTLVVKETALDFTKIVDLNSKVSNFEAIDLGKTGSTGNQDVTLTINAKSVLDITDNDKTFLKIFGDSKDKVNAADSWTKVTDATNQAEHGFTRYSSDTQANGKTVFIDIEDTITKTGGFH